ncbi:hypothetical protein GCK32_019326 [Trichostrongylus colubriformis]|uniref:Uncharacterized protein n=1 Tax=Trichostrongylus colubriformis TaxID=6319 RepID=A0AAN8FV45_TRICO
MRWKRRTGMSRARTKIRTHRYYTCRSFVAWAYGHHGLGNHYELAARVRAAIMATYPSSGSYVGFASWVASTGT